MVTKYTKEQILGPVYETDPTVGELTREEEYENLYRLKVPAKDIANDPKLKAGYIAYLEAKGKIVKLM